MTIFRVSQNLDFSFKNYEVVLITSILGDLPTGVEQIHLYDREKGISKAF